MDAGLRGSSTTDADGGPSVPGPPAPERSGGGSVVRDPLTLSVLVDTFGTGMFMPLVLPYLTTVNGNDPASAGTAVGVATFASLLLAVPIGRLLGRLGARGGLLLATLLSITGYLGFLVAYGGPAVLAVFLVVAAADRLHAAAWPVMAAVTFGRSGLVPVFATVEALRTACLLAGVLTATAAVRLDPVDGLRFALVANVVTYAVSLLLLRRARDDRPGRSTGAEPGAAPALRPRVLRDRRFALLLVSQTFLTMAWLVPLTVFPLYVLEVLDAPAYLATAPLLLRYAIVIAAQVRLTRRTGTWSRPRLVVVCAGLALAGLGAAATTPGLAPARQLLAGAVAVVLLAVSEVLGKPTGAALAVQLSPHGQERAYTSVYQLSSAVPVALLPVLVGVLVARPGALWGALAVPLLAAALLGVVEARTADRPGPSRRRSVRARRPDR